ncbi:MAG TPA: ribosome small subunit-dependent GTPase A [Steroidobacteraceae bacterium]|nr:ribosome small subunit-dependent GTPase A [Steroidobacteraceae bacterium]
MDFTGTVIASFGRHVLVRDPEGRERRARPATRRLSVVSGDAVRCTAEDPSGEALVVALEPRRTALYRANSRGGSEIVVANLTLLLVVLAPVPEPDLFLVDRYLCAAASTALRATLLVNKCELGLDVALRRELAAFERIGYRAIECSARLGLGVGALLEACAGATAALVGQSGVGKSSLVSGLAPQMQVATGELAREQHGRHTTTASRLYDLGHGGALIDSPGVRDFAPALEQLEPASLGFIEIAELAGACRFSDCRHLGEPDCAVRSAAASGALHARRYESYRRLRRLRDSLSAARGPAKPRRRST